MADSEEVDGFHNLKRMELPMSKYIGVVMMIAALSFSAGTILAADPMKEKEAKPSMGERLTKDAVKGTLMKIDGEYYVIKNNDGEQVRLHVDKSTKLDKVVEGDKVKAYVTEKGHVTTLQRQEK
jgi:hypothetical protein